MATLKNAVRLYAVPQVVTRVHRPRLVPPSEAHLELPHNRCCTPRSQPAFFHGVHCHSGTYGGSS